MSLMKKIKVDHNQQYLVYEDNTPFFYLADTAWCAPQKLSREDWQYYLRIRSQQGFQTVQICALSEDDGLAKANYYGCLPFLPLRSDGCLIPDEQSDYSYWDHLDWMIEEAQKFAIVIALLPTWGDKFNRESHGIGPEIFNESNAYCYGRWIAKRYRKYDHIIWVLGGDRALRETYHTRIIDRMAEGIREIDQEHLITFHPCGAASSVDFLSNRSYLDFHSIQSGHGLECYDSWRMIRNTVKREHKPCLDMESRYEDFPACFREDIGYCWDDADIRQNIYWNMMEGACGLTYGHRSVWRFEPRRSLAYPFTWKEALERPGAQQMQYAERLRRSRPFLEFRAAPELTEDYVAPNAHIGAGRGEEYAFFYSPLGLPIKIHLEPFAQSPVKLSWFDPRTGTETPFSVVDAKKQLIVPPTSGKGNDWVLIADCMAGKKKK